LPWDLDLPLEQPLQALDPLRLLGGGLGQESIVRFELGQPTAKELEFGLELPLQVLRPPRGRAASR